MSYADATRSLEELIFSGVTQALTACGCSMNDIDSVVLASHDLVDGRSLSSMVTAPAAGAYLRDEIRLAEDGLAAFTLASARIAAGESRACLVAAWGRASEDDTKRLPFACMDPFFEQAFGLTEDSASALRYSRWLSAHGVKQEAKQRAAAKRRARAAANPRAIAAGSPSRRTPWPLDDSDAVPQADIVVATVLQASPGPIRVAGIGQQTDLPRLGDRDWLGQPALREAAARALHVSGRKFTDMEAIEIDGMTLSDEALALEAVGLATAGSGFDAYASDERINRSGGSAGGWCYPAMGLVRLAEVVERMRGGVRRGIAIGSGPIARQTCTAVVLEVA